MLEMVILLVHNRYQQAGGEDMVFAEESSLLRRHGHHVVEYVEDNRRIDEIGRPAAAMRSVWSSGTRLRLRDLIRRERPEVAHFHNIFPLISPSAYWACRETGTPVVQTLHNYRLLCAAALFFRSGRPCEDCLGKRFLWPGVFHGCYRGSRLETAGVTMMLETHRMIGTWRNKVDLFIALSEFSRRKFIEGGIAEGRIAVKPNFVHPDPGPGRAQGDFALFVGRLSTEKGIRVLLDAWRNFPQCPLAICGDGPMRDLVDRFAWSRPPGTVLVYGVRTRQEVFGLMKRARFLVFPSTCYENFPLVIADAFACGLPVISTDIGAAAEIVDHGRTGVHFKSGDRHSLTAAARRLWDRPREARMMGAEARAEFLSKFTAEANYTLLMNLYSQARESSGMQG
jgi:glycosyltransferase involved in cell wall biosynthesis